MSDIFFSAEVLNHLDKCRDCTWFHLQSKFCAVAPQNLANTECTDRKAPELKCIIMPDGSLSLGGTGLDSRADDFERRKMLATLASVCLDVHLEDGDMNNRIWETSERKLTTKIHYDRYANFCDGLFD
jgi:hypothetical protein